MKSWATKGTRITITMSYTPKSKLLWDFNIQTDNAIEHNKPDIVVVDKIELECLIVEEQA